MGGLWDYLVRLDEWIGGGKTLSLRAALACKVGKYCIFCKILNFFKRDHCANVLKNSGM